MEQYKVNFTHFVERQTLLITIKQYDFTEPTSSYSKTFLNVTRTYSCTRHHQAFVSKMQRSICNVTTYFFF